MLLDTFLTSLNSLRVGLVGNHSSIPLLIVLTVLVAEKENRALSVKQLGLTIGCSLPILTKHLNQLRSGGFVSIVSAAVDKRQRVVISTEKLRALIRNSGFGQGA